MIDPIATYARSRPHAPACIDLATGRHWTYAALHADVDRAAAGLCARLGPASGERVATLARNSAAMLIVHLACARAGAVFVPLNWRLTPAELGNLMADAEPALLFHDRDFGATAAAIAVRTSAELLDLGIGGEGLAALVADSPAAPPADARRAFDAPATLLYTSGTSGVPKGVIVTEANAFFGCTNFVHGADVHWGSVFLCDMPMFHTAGLFAATRTPLLAGASVLISRGFDAPVTLARIADPALRVTHYFAVPQMAARLWHEPGFEPAMLRGLTAFVTGGAPHPAAQVERLVRAGIRVSNGFGMSETGSNIHMPMEDVDLQIAKAGSCGLPLMSVRARIVGEDGHDVADGEPGELWIAGPSVTPGYWNRPHENARAFVNGWFRTGDTARRDADGFYWLIDRTKDMYISGGENVYPAEVEAALAELTEIAECAVIGVPDARWGEVGRAYVIARPGVTIGVEVVAAFCGERLARYKVPASVVITDTIPRNAAGKVQKHVLKARAADEMA